MSEQRRIYLNEQTYQMLKSLSDQLRIPITRVVEKSISAFAREQQTGTRRVDLIYHESGYILFDADGRPAEIKSNLSHDELYKAVEDLYNRAKNGDGFDEINGLFIEGYYEES